MELLGRDALHAVETNIHVTPLSAGNESRRAKSSHYCSGVTSLSKQKSFNICLIIARLRF